MSRPRHRPPPAVRSLLAIAAALGGGLFALVSTAGAVLPAPTTACPGSLDGFALASRAPLFSWSLVESAAAYELVVLPAPAAGDEVVEPVVRVRLPAGVTTWTPAGAVLGLGEEYVWSVRAVAATEEATGESGGAWSAARWFRTPPAPAAAEVAAAIRWLGQRAEVPPRGAGPPLATRPAEDAARRAAPPTVGGSRVDPSPTLGGSGAERAAATLLASESAALQARGPVGTGPASGLVGIVHSPDGAGVVASNLGGGPDLVLSGIEGDPGDAGRLRSEVQGPLVVESGPGVRIEMAAGASLLVSDGGEAFFTIGPGGANGAPHGDGAGLTDVTASGLSCADCLTGTEISGGITGSDVQDGALTGDDVAGLTSNEVGALAGADVADGTITASQLATGSIGSAELADDSVGAAEIATGAVTAAKIEAGSIQGNALGPIYRVKVECHGECTDSTLGEICALVAGSRPIAVTCSEVDPFTPSTACGGDNQCLTLSITATTLLSDYCVDVVGADAMVFCLDD